MFDGRIPLFLVLFVYLAGTGLALQAGWRCLLLPLGRCTLASSPVFKKTEVSLSRDLFIQQGQDLNLRPPGYERTKLSLTEPHLVSICFRLFEFYTFLFTFAIFYFKKLHDTSGYYNFCLTLLLNFVTFEITPRRSLLKFGNNLSKIVVILHILSY